MHDVGAKLRQKQPLHRKVITMTKLKTALITLFCASIIATNCLGASISRLELGKNGSRSINAVIAEIETALTANVVAGSTPTNAVASTGTLTVAAQATTNDTITIGTTVYTFVTNGSVLAVGDISVGSDLASCQSNIVKAINGESVVIRVPQSKGKNEEYV